MIEQDYNLKVTASDGTKLKAVLCQNCTGCYLSGKDDCGNSKYECRSDFRLDNSDIIWARVEKEQPASKQDAIKEIRAKTVTLQKEIYNLIKTFEADTSMVVHGVNLLHDQPVAAARTTFGVELDVRLN